jgi:hypothetical protein
MAAPISRPMSSGSVAVGFAISAHLAGRLVATRGTPRRCTSADRPMHARYIPSMHIEVDR